MKKQVHFLSNHADISFLQSEFPDAEIIHIPHPYIEPEWAEHEVESACDGVIYAAVAAETLVANGEYFLIGTILRERIRKFRLTGFIAMKKFNEPSNEKDAEGRIVHKNIIKPVAIRWI